VGRSRHDRGYGVRVAAHIPRLVASDLDGTLVRSDGSVSDRTRAAVRRVEAAGALFVMVTARPPRWVDALADLTGDHGLAIVANGAILYDVASRKSLRTRMIEPSTALEVARAIRAAIPDVQFAIERADRYGQEPAYENKWPKPDESLVAEIAELLTEPAAKLLVRHPRWPVRSSATGWPPVTPVANNSSRSPRPGYPRPRHSLSSQQCKDFQLPRSSPSAIR
jgi:haloacid dehalogenase-like hydrolase